jgi:hypothetical protein
MSIQHATAILLRLAAIISLFYAARHLIWVLAMAFNSDPDNLQELLYGSAGILIFLIIGLSCWFFPMSAARMIVKPVWNKQLQPFNATALLRVLVIFAGLMYALQAVMAFTNFLFSLTLTGAYAMPSNVDQLKATYATYGLQLVLGLMLIIKNHWISQSLLQINRPENPNQSG